jgi:hypothetical protein
MLGLPLMRGIVCWLVWIVVSLIISLGYVENPRCVSSVQSWVTTWLPALAGPSPTNC